MPTHLLSPPKVRDVYTYLDLDEPRTRTASFHLSFCRRSNHYHHLINGGWKYSFNRFPQKQVRASRSPRAEQAWRGTVEGCDDGIANFIRTLNWYSFVRCTFASEVSLCAELPQGFEPLIMMLCRHDPSPFIGPNDVLCSESGVHCFLSMIFIHSIQVLQALQKFIYKEYLFSVTVLIVLVPFQLLQNFLEPSLYWEAYDRG